jgi:hypothetical protein
MTPSRNWPGKPEKITEILGIVSMSSEVSNRLLPNTSIAGYHHASLCDIRPVSCVPYVTYIVPRGTLRHSWRVEEKNALYGDHVRLSVRQSVILYQRLNFLSDFHEIRYRSYLRNKPTAVLLCLRKLFSFDLLNYYLICWVTI